ncbi:MAG: uroporphyrinogen-III synthase [Steroidobacteraceae bacterium]
MIPLVVPPLQGIAVLVTRPAAQATSVAARIRQLGGEAILLPAIAIEPIAVAVPGEHDLAIFVSSNAVEHGAHLIATQASLRVAAIGKSTAAALTALNIAVDLFPDTDSRSETLLAHPALDLASGARVLIVRGVGGRTLLQESLAARGMQVAVLEVYRRVLPPADPALLASLENLWSAGELNIVTVTSVETLTNLVALLGDKGFLCRVPLLVASARIAEAAMTMGLRGEIVLARGADDDSLVGALSYWQARERSAA